MFFFLLNFDSLLIYPSVVQSMYMRTTSLDLHFKHTQSRTKSENIVKERKENKEQIREKAFEYSVYNEDFSEKTEISSKSTDAVSTPDYDEEIVTAELVLNSLPSGDMELQ